MIDSRNGRSWAVWGLGLIGLTLMIAILLPVFVADRWWAQSLNFQQVQFAFLLAVVTLAVIVPAGTRGARASA